MQRKTFELLKQRRWMELGKHIEDLPKRSVKAEIRDTIGYLKDHHAEQDAPWPHEDVKPTDEQNVKPYVWRAIFNRLRSDVAYPDEQSVEIACDALNHMMKRRGTCLLTGVPGTVEGIRKKIASNEKLRKKFHPELIRILERVQTHPLAEPVTQDRAAAFEKKLREELMREKTESKERKKREPRQKNQSARIEKKFKNLTPPKPI